MIEDLRKQITKHFTDNQSTFQQEESTLNMAIQENVKVIKEKETTIANEKAKKAVAETGVGETSQELTTAVATLRDTQNYLLDMTKMANNKKSQYDQISQARLDELSALTQALVIVKGTVSEKTTGQTIRTKRDVTPDSFVQTAESSFVQVKQVKAIVKKSFMQSKSPRDRVMQLLSTASSKLHSTILASVASKTGKDPLAKVKTLIRELILRLQKEAEEEGNDKEYCDNNLNIARTARDAAEEKLTSNHLTALEREDKIAELTITIATLKKEIADLEAAQQDADDERAETKANNNNAIADAEVGKTAIEQATQVLKAYYNSQKGDDKELEKVETVTDAPDSGIKTNDDYVGNQAASKGILGLFEVILSDFERTISETKDLETAQESAYVEFSTVTQSSIKEKTNAKDDSKDRKTAREAELATANTNFDEAVEELDQSNTELEELRKACIDTEMSYEERVAKREAEIDALQEAHKILDEYSQ